MVLGRRKWECRESRRAGVRDHSLGPDDQGGCGFKICLCEDNIHDNFQEETWATDANAFVAQEEDEAQTYSFKIAAFDLLSVCFAYRPSLSLSS
jgi:hypothetical protein